MWALWILLLTSSYASSRDVDTTRADTNITTLYPVNKIIPRPEPKTTAAPAKDAEPKPSVTETKTSDTETNTDDTRVKINETEARVTPPQQTWKLESGFVESNITDGETAVEIKEDKEKKKIVKDFKPSQHLGSFFDDESAEVINTPGFGLYDKKPASGFVSFPKEQYHQTFNKIPKEVYETYKKFPYRFEDTYTRPRDGWQEMDSKPTVEVPVKIPAGGLYQSPEAFKDKPQEEEFGLVYHEDDAKGQAVKKRGNPWQNLLRLVTAFIPVGLIISALTPSVVTIHNVDDKQPPNLPYRRSDAELQNMSPISEQCRRRLLCELHSDRHYIMHDSLAPRRKKRCYKIHCEDTEALWKMLRWLFTYNQGEQDSRTRFIT